MAKKLKQATPSRAVEITPPQFLVPLMQAFHVDSDKVARALVQEAALAIYGQKDSFSPFDRKKEIQKSELDSIISIMRGLNPMDTLETLYAAQIVVGHMLGMKHLSKSYTDDKKLGLDLLKFSSESMRQLHSKRAGGNQNITVNYNYTGTGNALMQAVVPNHKGGKCQ